MDQLVNRPRTEKRPSVEPALGFELKRAAPRRLRRVLYALVVLVAASALGAYLFYSPAAEVSYTSVPVKTGDITVEITATGALQPLTQVDISSELSGVVRSVLVDENQRVSKGDVLAELDTVRLTAQVERAEASVKAADAKLLETQTTLKETDQALVRAEALSKRGMVTDQLLDSATAARDRAAANVAMAEASLAIARADLKLQQADLEKSRIYAPIDGILLTRSVNPGQTVASSMQAPVLFVLAAGLENMELKAAIDEADIGGVRSGQTARFTVDAFPDRKFDAAIKDIAYASVTTEGVVTYDAKLEVDNQALLLRPGMTATVSVITRQADGVLTVPAAAFRYAPQAERRAFTLRDLFAPRIGRPGGPRRSAAPDDGTRTLYVLKDGAPEAVRVRTGATDGEMTEIESGLAEGDLVVTGQSQRAN